MHKKNQLSRRKLIRLIEKWMEAWNEHQLDDVMSLFHDNAEFIAWNGTKVKGKRAIRYAWETWFDNHDDFNFKVEQIIVDESQQSVMLIWVLNWLSAEPGFKGKHETRLGVDYLYFQERLLLKKYSYCKTVIKIDQNLVKLQADKY